MVESQIKKVKYMFVMKLESVGIIVAMRPFGERDVVAHIFTENNGMLSGMLRGAVVAKNKPMVGQMGAVAWGARLESQLGVFHFEAQKNLSVVAMMDNKNLAYMNSMFALLVALLPSKLPSNLQLRMTTLEPLWRAMKPARSPSPLTELLSVTDERQLSMLTVAPSMVQPMRPAAYLALVCRAVCRNCGAPYVDKLFRLPVNLGITLRFLENACRGLDVSVPNYRIFLQKK